MKTEFAIYTIETEEDLELFKAILECQEHDKDKVFVFDVTMPGERLAPKFKYYVYFESTYFLQNIKYERLIQKLRSCKHASSCEVTLDPNDPRRIYKFSPIAIKLDSKCMIQQARPKKYIFNVKTWSDLNLLKRLLKRQKELPNKMIIFDLTKPSEHIVPEYVFCIYVENEYYYDTFHDKLMIDLNGKVKCKHLDLCNIDFDDPRRFTKFEDYIIE